MVRKCAFIGAALLWPALMLAQDASPGGDPRQRLGEMLQKAHDTPDAQWSEIRTRMLGRIKSRLREGSSASATLQARAAEEAGRLLDQGHTLSEADFSRDREKLLDQLLSAIRQGMNSGAADKPSSIRWIDVHNHLLGGQDFDAAVQATLKTMDQAGVSRALVMPPPQVPEMTRRGGVECEAFFRAVRAHGDRIGFLAGGSSLNSILQQYASQSSVSEAVGRKFEQTAEGLVKLGAAGFGEMALHHLSLHGQEHPYESVAADHPLMLRLADLAARHDLPIDVHLDLVVREIPTPTWLTSKVNPRTLPANLAAFERLLSHNPKASICLEHVGSDNIGHLTAALAGELLSRHPNLFMSLRMGPGFAPENFVLTRGGEIKSEWLEVFKANPSRFVIGSDRFFASPTLKSSPGSLMGQLTSRGNLFPPFIGKLLEALPPELARRIASENAMALYHLR